MDKKQLIIDAAVKVFSEKGVENTKISDIVREAGIAQGTFYLYFPSKFSVMPEIAKLVVSMIIEEVDKSVNSTSSFQNQLEQLIRAVFTLTDKQNKLFTLLYAGLSQSEHLKQWEEIYAPFYNWMFEFLERAKQNGDIRENIHSARTAKLMIAIIESTAEQLYLYDESAAEEIELQFKELLSFVNHALK